MNDGGLHNRPPFSLAQNGGGWRRALGRTVGRLVSLAQSRNRVGQGNDE